MAIKTKNLEKYGFELLPETSHRYARLLNEEKDEILVFRNIHDYYTPYIHDYYTPYIQALDKDTLLIHIDKSDYMVREALVSIIGPIKNVILKSHSQVLVSPSIRVDQPYNITCLDNTFVRVGHWNGSYPIKFNLELHDKAQGVIEDRLYGVEKSEVFLYDDSICSIDSSMVKGSRDSKAAITAYSNSTVEIAKENAEHVNINLYDNAKIKE